MNPKFHGMSTKAAEGLLEDSASEIKILEYITEPFTNLIVRVSHSGIHLVPARLTSHRLGSRDKEFRRTTESLYFKPTKNYFQTNSKVLEEWANGECGNCSMLLKNCSENGIEEECTYLFYLLGWGDQAVGIVLIVVSLLG